MTVPVYTEGFEKLLSLDEAAAILRRSHWTLRRDIKQGRLSGLRIGKKLFVEASELHRVLTESRLAVAG
jgi:excisionase family DNA binding protein